MQYLRSIIKFNTLRRNPFSDPKIPIWIQLFRIANLRWRRYARILIGIPLSFLWKPFFRLGAASKGTFVFKDQREKEHKIQFRAGNTQFASIYFDQFRDGFEPEVAALIDVLTHESSVLYDIGSNWGHHSLYLASKPHFKGKIFAFEPFPDTFQDLISIVDQAGLSSTIRCHKIALSNQPGVQKMSFPDAISSGLAKLDSKGNGPAVSIESLDHLNLEADPDVIKLDAEGEEAKILQGGRQLLLRSKPMIILESFRDVENALDALERFKTLEDMGYVFFQAVFLRTEDLGQYAIQISWEDPLGDLPHLALGLYEFKWEERFLFGGSNFLACHKDRISELLEYSKNKTTLWK